MEGCSQLSVKYTPSTLASISSSSSPLSAKLCSMSVHQSVQKLEFNCIICRHIPISHTRGIVGSAVDLSLSNAHPQLWCLSAPLCLKLCSMSVHRSVKKLEFYRIFSRHMPILHIAGSAVICCPSNVHPQL